MEDEDQIQDQVVKLTPATKAQTQLLLETAESLLSQLVYLRDESQNTPFFEEDDWEDLVDVLFADDQKSIEDLLNETFPQKQITAKDAALITTITKNLDHIRKLYFLNDAKINEDIARYGKLPSLVLWQASVVPLLKAKIGFLYEVKAKNQRVEELKQKNEELEKLKEKKQIQQGANPQGFQPPAAAAAVPLDQFPDYLFDFLRKNLDSALVAIQDPNQLPRFTQAQLFQLALDSAEVAEFLLSNKVIANKKEILELANKHVAIIGLLLGHPITLEITDLEIKDMVFAKQHHPHLKTQYSEGLRAYNLRLLKDKTIVRDLNSSVIGTMLEDPGIAKFVVSYKPEILKKFDGAQLYLFFSQHFEFLVQEFGESAIADIIKKNKLFDRYKLTVEDCLRLLNRCKENSILELLISHLDEFTLSEKIQLAGIAGALDKELLRPILRSILPDAATVNGSNLVKLIQLAELEEAKAFLMQNGVLQQINNVDLSQLLLENSELKEFAIKNPRILQYCPFEFLFKVNATEKDESLQVALEEKVVAECDRWLGATETFALMQKSELHVLYLLRVRNQILKQFQEEKKLNLPLILTNACQKYEGVALYILNEKNKSQLVDLVGNDEYKKLYAQAREKMKVLGNPQHHNAAAAAVAVPFPMMNNVHQAYDYRFKISLRGKDGIGKRNLISRFIGREARSGALLGEDLNLNSKIIDMAGENIKLVIESIDLNSRFVAPLKEDACILAYDIADKDSYDSVINVIKHHYNPQGDTKIVLLGFLNENSLRVIPYHRVKALADFNGLQFIEIAAKNDTASCEAVFNLAVREIITHKKINIENPRIALAIQAFETYVAGKDKDSKSTTLHEFWVRSVRGSAPSSEKVEAVEKVIAELKNVSKTYTMQDVIALTTSDLGKLLKEWADVLQNVLHKLLICELSDYVKRAEKESKNSNTVNAVKNFINLGMVSDQLSGHPEIKKIFSKYEDFGFQLNEEVKSLFHLRFR
jgi:hypothetical protein